MIDFGKALAAIRELTAAILELASALRARKCGACGRPISEPCGLGAKRDA